MRFVDHDPVAAGAAASACRDAAETLRARARELSGGMGDHLAAWSGEARLGFDATLDDLTAGLRSEADALDATADAIDDATRRARSTESDRRLADAERERENAGPRPEHAERVV